MKRTRIQQRRLRVAVINELADFKTNIGRSVHFMETVEGLNHEAYDNNIELYYYDRDFDLSACVKKKEHRTFDGIIGTVAWWPRKRECVWDVIAHDVPCVYMHNPPRTGYAYYVGVDECKAMDMLVGHLKKEGHETIGFAAASAQHYTQMRYIGYRDALKHHGLKPCGDHVVGIDVTTSYFPAKAIARYEKGEQHSTVTPRTAIYDHYTHLVAPPSAIIFENDYLAIHFYRRALSDGIRIPYRFGIAGFDNERLRFARYSNFLTTVDQPYKTIGITAIRLLADVIAGDADPLKHIRVEPKLIVRRSTLKRTLKHTKQSDDELKRTIDDFIMENFADPDRMKEIAATFMMSRDYFRQRFSRLFGMPFTAYLNDMRLSHAADALKKTSRSITRIIIESGFNNYQNFSFLFKKKFGVTPRHFRTTDKAGTLSSDRR
ncbi:MAG: substrate-binding domain-containing protein [Spirochaetes bacterium]|nr:substrate-binding domain-containing protein [Spirochaetota bacterium]